MYKVYINVDKKKANRHFLFLSGIDSGIFVYISVYAWNTNTNWFGSVKPLKTITSFSLRPSELIRLFVVGSQFFSHSSFVYDESTLTVLCMLRVFFFFHFYRHQCATASLPTLIFFWYLVAAVYCCFCYSSFFSFFTKPFSSLCTLHVTCIFIYM